MSLTSKRGITLPAQVRASLNRRAFALSKKVRAVEALPRPNATFSDWRKATIREFLTLNPDTAAKIAKLVDDGMEKTG